MSRPTRTDVHVNAVLTNISIAYLQDPANFVASSVFPGIDVAKQSDTYYIFDRGDFNRDEMQKRAPGTESAGSGYGLSTASYSCDKWSLHRDIPEDIEANEDAVLNSDRNTTQFLAHKALIRKERIWATNYFGSSIWTTDSTPSTLWNADSSTPIADIRTGKRTVLQSTGFEPNTLVLGKFTFDGLMDNADIVDRIKYGQTPGAPAMADTEALAKLFGVDRVLVTKAIYNTAKEGQTASHSFIGGNHALLCYVPAVPGKETPSAGYTFNWTGLYGVGATVVKRIPMAHLESNRVELSMAFDMKMVSADLGYFFADAVS